MSQVEEPSTPLHPHTCPPTAPQWNKSIKGKSLRGKTSSEFVPRFRRIVIVLDTFLTGFCTTAPEKSPRSAHRDSTPIHTTQLETKSDRTKASSSDTKQEQTPHRVLLCELVVRTPCQTYGMRHRCKKCWFQGRPFLDNEEKDQKLVGSS